MGPKGLKYGDRVGIVFGENVAQAEEVARLLRVGLVANDGRERRDGSGIIASAVFHEADIEADAGHFGFQFFGFLKKGQGLVPFFTAHGNHAEVGVSRGGLGIDR